MERPHKRLTPARIKSAAPSGDDLWLSDDTGIAGTGRLLLRVSSSGSKRWYYRPPRGAENSSPIPLGLYSHVGRPGYLTLTQARARSLEEAAKFLHRRSATVTVHIPNASAIATRTPGRDLEAAVSQGRENSSGTLASLCAAYADHLKRRKKVSAKDTQGYFEREIYAHPLGQREAASIKSREFTAFFRDLVARKSGYTACKLRSLVYSAYSMALQSELDPSIALDGSWEIESNPLEQVKAMSDFMLARERSLSKEELSALLSRLCLTEANTAGMTVRAVRLSLLLGGQRYEQLLRVELKAIDLAAGTIKLIDTKGRRKSPRRHVLPILPAARGEVEWLIDRANARGSTWLFVSESSDEHMDSNLASKLIRRYSASMVAAGQAVEAFQLSDLRRTAETLMASLGIHKDHRAQVLSHGIAGVQDRHYDKYDYLPEKKRALIKWQALLRQLEPKFI